jgi:hypothetical protein
MRLSKFYTFAFTSILLCGCNRPASTSNSAVVVDLDAVARAMGRDLVIDGKVEQATQALNARLITAADTMEKEYKKQQVATGSSPTDEQRTKLKQMAQKIQETIRNNKEVASQARQRFRLEQIQLFRNDVRTVASKLAEKQRATMVFVAGQEVLWFTPTADITAPVIAAMRSQALSPSENETQRVSTATETNATSTQNVSGATNATSGETNP